MAGRGEKDDSRMVNEISWIDGKEISNWWKKKWCEKVSKLVKKQEETPRDASFPAASSPSRVSDSCLIA